MKLITYFLILVLLFSCVTKKKASKYATHDTVIKTEFREKVVIKDSLIVTTVPASSAFEQAYWECDSLGQLHFTYIDKLETDLGTARARLKLVGNIVQADCRCDSLAIYTIMKTRETTVVSSSDQNTSSTADESIVKTKLPWWVFPGAILLFIIGGIIGYLIKMLT